MPREQINFPKIRTENPGTPNERHVADDAICAHVGWNKAGWVQVSLSLSCDRLSQIAKDYETGAHVSSTEAALFSDVLDRAELNKMIQTLRKARDQAYGKDA